MGDKFENFDVFDVFEIGCFVFKDCFGYVECWVVGFVVYGDYIVFVGEVIGV